MKRRKNGFYHALVILPDRLYPFRNQVSGHWVRGIRSYNAALARYQRAYGLGHYGYKLGTYRQIFHFVGSILVLVFSAYLSQLLFGNANGIYVFLAIAVAFISYQEFYLHRKMYEQLWRKGILDWLAWCVPIGIYLVMHLR